MSLARRAGFFSINASAYGRCHLWQAKRSGIANSLGAPSRERREIVSSSGSVPSPNVESPRRPESLVDGDSRCAFSSSGITGDAVKQILLQAVCSTLNTERYYADIFGVPGGDCPGTFPELCVVNARLPLPEWHPPHPPRKCFVRHKPLPRKLGIRGGYRSTVVARGLEEGAQESADKTRATTRAVPHPSGRGQARGEGIAPPRDL
jgi:hypothetical protein